MGYYGGALKNHGHTSLPGDGGLLSNLTLGGTLNFTDALFSGTLTGGAISAGSIVGSSLGTTSGGISVGAGDISLQSGRTLTVGGVNYLAPPLGLIQRLHFNSLTSASFVDILNITTTGRLWGISVDVTATETCDLNIILDGTDLGTATIAATDQHVIPGAGGTASTFQMAAALGSMNDLGWFFKTSLRIQARRTAGANPVTIDVAYERS